MQYNINPLFPDYSVIAGHVVQEDILQSDTREKIEVSNRRAKLMHKILVTFQSFTNSVLFKCPWNGDIYEYMFICMLCIYIYVYIYMVESHEMDSLLKIIFSNPNGIFTCYSMYLNRQSIKVMDDNLHS